jgi:hypothetical protein
MKTNSEIKSNKNKPFHMNDSTRVVRCNPLHNTTLATPCKSDVEANWSCYNLHRCLRFCLE